ncbi:MULTISPECIES: O-methyltransferase [Acetobacterium]|uniref:tRNA 5-hydroxyuridine methyltransferase n=1 Tax=Acetobacterium wieringae TaxID=52694 RepID=A0A1F2PHD4_9FIRM|nr:MULTISPECIES: O-methyltransferase [Acetobacterium]MEA4806798.1 O-methyltransferase [Acetobacterium wieringae]OFV70723.1 putative O-methyltransferase [Acetobacterium wieringae]OXS27306.1 MAG: methyltransferase [Acetobacterium sp. MES1]URN83633.1 O-methyltransferase [Acetobacterium wieringae]
MSEIVQDYIEDYLRGLIPADRPQIEEFRKRAMDDAIPIIHKEVQKHIELLIAAQKIRTILEVGTAVGFSASIFAQAMGSLGQVDTIERNLNMVVQADENITSLGLKNQINLMVGDAQEKLAKLEKTYDMIFLDGAKGHYIHLLDDCLRCLKPGGLLISDNVLFKGMIATNELVIRRKITIVKRMRVYLETISNHPQLITSILPLGDGLAISWKKNIETI